MRGQGKLLLIVRCICLFVLLINSTNIISYADLLLRKPKGRSGQIHTSRDRRTGTLPHNPNSLSSQWNMLISNEVQK